MCYVGFGGKEEDWDWFGLVWLLWHIHLFYDSCYNIDFSWVSSWLWDGMKEFTTLLFLGWSTCYYMWRYDEWKFFLWNLQMVKHVRTTFPRCEIKSNKIFSLLHTNMWGPSGIQAMSWCQYFIFFIDDYSWNTFVYFIWNWSEVFNVIQKFLVFIEIQYQTCVQIIWSENSKEFISHHIRENLYRKVRKETPRPRSTQLRLWMTLLIKIIDIMV